MILSYTVYIWKRGQIQNTVPRPSDQTPLSRNVASLIIPALSEPTVLKSLLMTKARLKGNLQAVCSMQ